MFRRSICAFGTHWSETSALRFTGEAWESCRRGPMNISSSTAGDRSGEERKAKSVSRVYSWYVRVCPQNTHTGGPFWPGLLIPTLRCDWLTDRQVGKCFIAVLVQDFPNNNSLATLKRMCTVNIASFSAISLYALWLCFGINPDQWVIFSLVAVCG